MNEKKSNIISKGLTIIIWAILIGNAALKDYESMKNRPTELIEELSNEDSLSFSVINDSFGNNKALLISSNVTSITFLFASILLIVFSFLLI